MLQQPWSSSAVTFISVKSATTVTMDDIQWLRKRKARAMRFRTKLSVMDSSNSKNLRTGCSVPERGIYSVSHRPHALLRGHPRSVNLIFSFSYPKPECGHFD